MEQAAALLGALYVVKTMDGRETVGLRLAGLLHPMADGIKSAFKEDFIPLRGRLVPRSTVYLDAVEGGRVEEVLVEQGGHGLRPGQ